MNSRKWKKQDSKRCPVAGKRRFRDHREAIDALHSVLNLRQRQVESVGFSRRQEKRVYLCHLCTGWHLTSQEWIVTSNKAA